MGDGVMIYKHIVKNLAREQMKAATFMPKPVFMDTGSGMHTHQSLWKDQQKPVLRRGRLRADQQRLPGITSAACSIHAPALLAFCAPTTNSYCRLVPGYEAPINLAYSQRNRSACIPDSALFPPAPKAKRLEFRSPDPSANIYLAMSAMLMAGLDGIQNRMDPGIASGPEHL